MALRDQKEYPNLRLGEILALRGWLKQTTIDFFLEDFPILLRKKYTLLIGEGLRQADLLSDMQIYYILLEQREKQRRFGEIAVQKGWLRPKTVDFFADSLTRNRTGLESKLVQELKSILQSRQMNDQQQDLLKAAMSKNTDLSAKEIEGIRKVYFYLAQGSIKLVS